MLSADLCGEIELLRSARVLRRIEGDMERALRALRPFGQCSAYLTAAVNLGEMDRQLRVVLLGYPTMRREEIRSCLVRALELCRESLQLVAALESSDDSPREHYASS